MKILVVLPRFPFPLEKGDKLRAYHQIVELSHRHEVYLFAVSHSAVDEEQLGQLRPFCRDIRVVRPGRVSSALNVVRNFVIVRSLQLGYWNTRRTCRAYRDFERAVQPDVVYCQMVRTMPLLKRSTCPKVMDFQDALSLNTERRMEQSCGLARYVLHYEFKMLRSLEYDAFRHFDALTIISDTDADAIPHSRNGEIVIVPNGVDTDHFSPASVAPADGAAAPHNSFALCFVGNMAYAPNVDAARFLVQEVMPLVWQRFPEVRLLLAGANPKPAVRALASERVSVSGTLADIRDAYASSRLFVAPMRIGSGLQNKLLEAMSMSLPCVTTTLAATPVLQAVRATSVPHSQPADSTSALHAQPADSASAPHAQPADSASALHSQSTDSASALHSQPADSASAPHSQPAASSAPVASPLLVADTPAALADHIVALLSDPDQIRRRGEEGRRFVQDHFAWPAAVALLEQTLQKVASTRQ